MTHAGAQSYKTTESKYKGGAEEMYVTYDLWQETRGDGRALYPKVKRVYIAGQVKDWHVGTFAKRTGKHVHGVKLSIHRAAWPTRGRATGPPAAAPNTTWPRRRCTWALHGSPRSSKYRKRRTTCSSMRENSPRATATPSRTYARCLFHKFIPS